MEFRPGAQLGNIKADPGQIEQVAMNLVVNARDAMPIGGRILIETATANLTTSMFPAIPALTSVNTVVLIVSDTGCGMDETVKAQIFEPFFTTKPLGRGVGLGLLGPVYGIVKQSEGYVWCTARSARAQHSEMYFPSVSEKAKQLAPLAVTADPARGSNDTHRGGREAPARSDNSTLAGRGLQRD